MKPTLEDLNVAEEFVAQAELHLREHKRVVARVAMDHAAFVRQYRLLKAYEFALTEHTRRRDAIKAALQADGQPMEPPCRSDSSPACTVGASGTFAAHEA
jgi:hypothetical protein